LLGLTHGGGGSGEMHGCHGNGVLPWQRRKLVLDDLLELTQGGGGGGGTVS